MPAPAVNAGAPGWFGKLPALGDFAGRRLPPQFLAPWDAWLQRALHASRGALGARWEAAWLEAPVWRFALAPGVCGGAGWAGALLPSADRVGRRFPLTIAAAFESAPHAALGAFAAPAWFGAIERIALDAVRGGARAEQLDAALLAAPYPDTATAADPLVRWWLSPGPRPLVLQLANADSAPELVRAAALEALGRAGAARTLWWRCPPAGGGGELRAFAGLPPEGHDRFLLAPQP